MRRGKLAPFFQKSGFRVLNPIKTTRRKPIIEIEVGEDVLMAVSLAKNGFFNGNPELVLNSPVDIVVHTYNFNNFIQDYEETSIELNKEQK